MPTLLAGIFAGAAGQHLTAVEVRSAGRFNSSRVPGTLGSKMHTGPEGNHAKSRMFMTGASV